MTIHEWLKQAVNKLKAAGIETARLDALILLSDEVGHDKGFLLAHPEEEISTPQLAKLDNLLTTRATHMPLAYLRGKAEFYGREFIVNPSVLVPRPETETMIEVLLEIFTGLKIHDVLPSDGRQWKIADVGTGSGAVGITAALELPETAFTLLDIDEAALEIAKANVINLSTTCKVVHTNLLQGINTDFDVLLCNLPYVPDTYQINTAAGHEPKIAIFGGQDGLDVYRQLFDQIKIVANKPLYILTEALPQSQATLTAIAIHAGYELRKSDDFIQVFSPAHHN